MSSAQRVETETETTTAAADLFKAPGLVAMAAVFVLAAWYSQTAMLLLAGLFLSTAGLARLWSRLSLAGVRAERLLEGRRFFPEETIECTLRLLNRKPLPLPWVQIEDVLPAGMEVVGPAGSAVRRSAALLWYRGISWKLRLVGRRRGYYRIGPLMVTSGDMLGLYSRSRRTASAAHLVVYPKIFPVDTRFIPSLHPMGEFQAARRLFRDPTHTIGVREYLRSDSLKFIHWKATARRGELQVKVLAATTAFKAVLLLDVDSFKPGGALVEADFELGISIAGSIAAALCERGSPVGLLANTRLADTGQPAVIAAGAGRDRVIELLETLAKFTDRSSGPAAALLEAQKSRLQAGTTLIFILSRPPDALSVILADLRKAGLKVMLLLVGKQEGPDLPPGVPWRRITTAEDLARGSLP